MAIDNPGADDVRTELNQETGEGRSALDQLKNMDKDRNKQPNNRPPDSEADFGDLGAELDLDDAPVAADEAAEMARRQEEMERKEAAESVVKMHQAQEAVLRALIEAGRTPDWQKLGELWDARLENPDDIRGIEEAPTEREKAAHANKVFVARLKARSGEILAVYKPRKGELHTYEERIAPERRYRKEWLGCQMDAIFAVGRSPAAVVREFSPPAGREDDPASGIGAVIEYSRGRHALSVPDWRSSVADEEIARVADFHYLIGETDGHDAQYFLEDDGRLTAIDRGESFLDNENIKFKSSAMEEALRRGLPPHPEVRQAAREFLSSPELQEAAALVFEAAFGQEGGKRRYEIMLKRVQKYVENEGVPYAELRKRNLMETIGRNVQG